MKVHFGEDGEKRCVAEVQCPFGGSVETRTWEDEVYRRRGNRTEAEYREYRKQYVARYRDAARGKKSALGDSSLR
ncbi:hypothetical protein GCM10009624_27020 [Gordonia sinesedis]